MHDAPLAQADLDNAFRAAMRRLATTVSVVTSSQDGFWHGMTATAVTSVCAAPPALLVCVNTDTAVYGCMRATGRYCVNLLKSSQVLVSRQFGSSRGGTERFKVGDWSGHVGLPYLRDAQASLFCATEQVIGAGTHGIFIGRIEEIRVAEEVQPLVYQNGSYVTTAPLEPR